MKQSAGSRPLERLAIPILVATALMTASIGGAACQSLSLDEFFVGRFVGEGNFRNHFEGTTRGIRLQLKGARVDGNLVLAEDFVFSDGEQKTFTWKFVPQGAGRYLEHFSIRLHRTPRRSDNFGIPLARSV